MFYAIKILKIIHFHLPLNFCFKILFVLTLTLKYLQRNTNLNTKTCFMASVCYLFYKTNKYFSLIERFGTYITEYLPSHHTHL